MANPSGLCSIDGCENASAKRGWCNMHYLRWYRRGDPLTKTLLRGDPDGAFWQKVSKDGPIHPICGQCWIWTARSLMNGYGRLKVAGRWHFAHRYSWGIHAGPIPNELCVLHRCDNPSCVNPTHLFLGTRGDNAADMVWKNRHAKGENVPWAKLTDEQVREIRSRYEYNSTTNGAYALARDFGVSQPTIARILDGRTWKHV